MRYEGGDRQHGGHRRDEQLRQPGANRLRQVVDVGGGPCQQVAGARALDEAEWEVEHGLDEPLAQPCEQAFARARHRDRGWRPVRTVWTTSAPSEQARRDVDGRGTPVRP